MGLENYESSMNEIMEEESEFSVYRNDEKWSVKNLETLIWCDSIIYEKEQAIAEKENIADNNISRLEEKITLLKEWKENATKKEKSDIDFFQSHMMVYHMKLIDEEKESNKILEANGKKPKPITKSIKLPFSTLACRAQAAEAFIGGKELTKAKDDPAFVQFVKENNPEFINEEVAWGEYKKTLKQTTVDGKLVYLDDASQFVDIIQLNERADKFERKANKKE